METYEDDLIEWYWKHQEKNLTNWFCIERVLDPGEDGKELAADVGVHRVIKQGHSTVHFGRYI